MNLHRNARLTPRGRRLLVEAACRQRVPLTQAGEAGGISPRTASKWVARFAVRVFQGWRIAPQRLIGWRSDERGACGCDRGVAA
jgi:hypothetical protein